MQTACQKEKRETPKKMETYAPKVPHQGKYRVPTRGHPTCKKVPDSYLQAPPEETPSNIPFQKGVDVEAIVANIYLPASLVGSKVASVPRFGSGPICLPSPPWTWLAIFLFTNQLPVWVLKRRNPGGRRGSDPKSSIDMVTDA